MRFGERFDGEPGRYPNLDVWIQGFKRFGHNSNDLVAVAIEFQSLAESVSITAE
jgi:hypothetical protein